MEDIIVKLLKENGRIIVPDFGAFIIKTKSPLKAIFNEFLQYNDGALIGAIATEDNTDRNNAASKVKEYVDALTAKLDSGETVSFPEIGTLTKSSTGKISLGDENAKQPDTIIQPSDSPETVDFDDTDKTPEPSSVLNTETEKPIEEPEQNTAPVTTPPPVVEETKSLSTTSSVKQPVIERNTGSEPSPISEYYNTDDSSRNKKKVILWIILIVLVNALIIGYFFFNNPLKQLFHKDKSGLPETAIETPAIIDDSDNSSTPVLYPSDTTQDSEPVIEQATEEEEVYEPEEPSREFSGNKYYVVAGVFSVEANADNMVNSLREKGYNAEKFGKIGSLYAVSFDVFPSKQEADNLMLKIKREEDLDAWIKVVK